MRLLYAAVAVWSLTSAIYAAPLKSARASSELPDGMPNPSPAELKRIEENAHGTLPNGPPPPVISDLGIANLQLIAFNELFEVAFFNELVINITTNVEGYRFSNDSDCDFVLRSLRAILAV